MESILELYSERFGRTPATVMPIAGAGSSRRYWRLTPGTDCGAVIATVGSDPEENRAFIALSKVFAGRGLAVPRVLAVSSDGMTYLQTDVGTRSLFDAVTDARASADMDLEHNLLENAVRLLAEFHKRASDIDFEALCPEPVMDARAVIADLNYFKYCFLMAAGVSFNAAALEADFGRLAARACALSTDGLLLRDFQSRNIMLDSDGLMSVIDFQGARRGPTAYDVASLLWQSRLALSDAERRRLTETYIEAACVTDRQAFMLRLADMRLLRMLQTLGAYGLRGLVEHKGLFLTSLPKALRELSSIPPEVMESMPELKRVVDSLMALRRFDSPAATDGRLTVSVGSFSYRRGIPEDMSGNGGGFVFDCRAIHNPGRYEEYRHLTGRDRQVREFLEERTDIAAFINHALAMVTPAVECYVLRGFSHLQVCFGCTGGRHRSVYCADAVARAIADAFPEVHVTLFHREQRIEEMLQ